MSRQIDTRLAVVRALDECMRSEPISRVRVARLCQVAGISRTTFYEYFEVIYAVPTWMWDYLMSQSLYLAGVTLDAHEAHVRKFEFLRSHQAFFEAAFRFRGYTSVVEHGRRSMTVHIGQVVGCKRGTGLTPDEARQLEFYVAGAGHMTRQWVEGGMAEEPEVMAQLFVGFIPAFALPYLEPDPTLVLPDDVTVPVA